MLLKLLTVAINVFLYQRRNTYMHVETISVALEVAYKLNFCLCLIQSRSSEEWCGDAESEKPSQER
jgi:hypothetical protein